MSARYRILCSVHGYQSIWSDTLVTECPINPADYVNQDMTCIDGMLRVGAQISPTTSTISIPHLTRIGSIFFDINSMGGSLQRVGIFSYCDVGVTSYTIEIYDKTNLVSLGSITLSNTNDYEINYINNITDLVTSPVMIEVNASVNSTIANKNAYISRVILFVF